MLLTIDAGNTNIVLGLFDGDELLFTGRLTTGIKRTSDEFGFAIREFMFAQKKDPSQIDGAIIASVVPNIMHSLTNSVIKYFGCTPLIVGPDIRTEIEVPNIKEVGADRIVDAEAAYRLYGGPVIVCDFGTATTYDLVTDKGAFGCGVTAPGIRSSAESLHISTAQLPDFVIAKPDTILALDTITSLQAGIVFGTIGEAEYIIRQIRKESGFTDAKVVVTGGLGRIIADETEVVDIYDPELTIKGLKMLYDMNQA